jgi:branched-chain amino acid transport system permease protein
MPGLAEWTSQITNGLILGLLYAMVALGFMLVLGVMEVINFSYGVLLTLGAYFALTLRAKIGYVPALLLCPLFVGIVGLFLERVTIRRVYGKDPLFGLLLTFGVAMSLEEIIRIIWGKLGHSFAAPKLMAGPIDLGFMFYSKYRLFLALLSALLIFLVWLFLEKTPYGAIIKAGVSDSEMVMALGKDLRKLRTYVFAFGATLAGIAGVIAAPIWSIKPTMGNDLLMASFVVVVLGGIGSFWGTVIGGLLVGLSISISVMFWPRFSLIVPYILMAVIILIRPRGIMGEKSLLE